MLKKMFFTVVLVSAVSTRAQAQPISYWGKYLGGAYPISDEQLRFFAFSYIGDLTDTNKIHKQTKQVVAEFDRTNKTHEWKDGNGNFNQLRLGQDHVFVIGWYNPKRAVYAFMATVPGGRTIVKNDGRTLTNTGWNRQRWSSNGYNVHLQLGNNHGMVQWQLGYDQ